MTTDTAAFTVSALVQMGFAEQLLESGWDAVATHPSSSIPTAILSSAALYAADAAAAAAAAAPASVPAAGPAAL